jgi:hypothetical protein
MVTPHDAGRPTAKVSGLFAAGLGATFQAVDVLVELVTETAQAVVGGTLAAAREADQRYREAAARGEAVIRRAATDVRDGADHAANAAAGWVDREIVRRVAESMKPYLIEELVPSVIDGVLPIIRTDVVPVVLADLADDDQVQTMVAVQSRDVLTRGVADIRDASSAADDRIEASLHRVLGRRGSKE